jgi:outer membrane lipase/esterase
MRRFFGVICAGSFALAVGTATAILPVAASPYTSMVVFGDSLSDSGNAALAVGATAPAITGNTYIPAQPYLPAADFSNGPVWASDVASALGVPLLPSFAGGTNFAVGGATTGGPFPSLLGQAASYLASTPGHLASSTALYVVEGGGNDARDALGLIGGGADVTSTIQSTALSFAANIASIVTSLKAGGAQHIIVWDTPNIGLAPAVAAGGAGAATLGSLLAADMNLALAGILAGDSGVSIFDIYGLGTTIAANPGAFGLVNVTDACGAPSNACDPATAEYWDGIHPTAAAHALIADAFLAEAVPEPSTWAMLLLGFAGVGFVAYRRKSAALPT